MELNNIIQQGILALKKGELEQAETSFKKAIKLEPNHEDIHHYLANTLIQLKNFTEAVVHYKRVIELRPDFLEAYFNLSLALNELGRLDEAEKICKKLIVLKPDYAEAYNSLGSILNNTYRLDEAEESFRKAISLKLNYAEAYNGLGFILNNTYRLDEAEENFRKAIKFKPNYTGASDNLDIILKQKDLLFKIKQYKKNKIKNDKSYIERISNIFFGLISPVYKKGLTLNPFISKKLVDEELLNYLYKIESEELGIRESSRYGIGSCSDYKLFKNNSLLIKNLADGLTKIMSEAVQSEIYIFESFFNIWRDGSGITSHKHTNRFDKISGLIKQKYSLCYYLATGNQDCSEPGILKLYDPHKEILPSKGSIVIFPADQKHSASYNGKKDRVMIGVNFYSIH